jgi:hypothetical protein
MNIILKYYDSLNTEMINGTAFLEHLLNKDLIGIASGVNLKCDLIPYIFHKILNRTEK